VACVRAAATIHDVGKLRVPVEVIRKPDIAGSHTNR
jgi:HD-GYP domain-containing protein (c-di-GMP phosphodiesterase class II)